MLVDPVTFYKPLAVLFTGRHFSDNHPHRIKLLEGVFHVNRPREEYIDKNCDFLFSFKTDLTKPNIISLFRSGLYDTEQLSSPLPILKDGNIYDGSSFTIDTHVGITREVIRSVYQDSLFPTAEDILRRIDVADPIPYEMFKQTVYSLTLRKKVHDLMQEFTGDHYYFVCRSYASNYALPLNNVLEIRGRSRNRSALMGAFDPTVPTVNHHANGKYMFNLFFSKMYITDEAIGGSKFKNTDPAGDHFIKTINLQLEIILRNPPESWKPKQNVMISHLLSHLNEGIARRLFKVSDISPIIMKHINKIGQYGIDIGALNV
jgi:hypothetical protein